jgi:hypothetical protein
VGVEEEEKGMGRGEKGRNQAPYIFKPISLMRTP